MRIRRTPTAVGRSVVGLAVALLLVGIACGIAAGPDRPVGGTSADVRPDGSEQMVDGHTLRSAAPEGFVIGTAVAGGGHHLDQPYPDPFSGDEEYRDVLAREFSSVTPENQMKWEWIHPAPGQYDFTAADAIVEFAERNGQVVRGHTLLWHSQNPAWLERGEYSKEELRAILEDHIRTVVGRYQGRIQQWDVANEIFSDAGAYRTENIWIRELGPEIALDAFRWAHEADPEATLFLNDYDVEDVNPKSDAYYALVQDMQAKGVPVGGFAVQAHLSMRSGFPSGLQENLQRFSDLGVETAVTEIDVRMEVPNGTTPTAAQEAQQADYYDRALEACLTVESCNSFTAWGFTDKYSWVPVFFPHQGWATVMTGDFERKPAYFELRESLRDETLAERGR